MKNRKTSTKPLRLADLLCDGVIDTPDLYAPHDPNRRVLIDPPGNREILRALAERLSASTLHTIRYRPSILPIETANHIIIGPYDPPVAPADSWKTAENAMSWMDPNDAHMIAILPPAGQGCGTELQAQINLHGQIESINPAVLHPQDRRRVQDGALLLKLPRAPAKSLDKTAAAGLAARCARTIARSRFLATHIRDRNHTSPDDLRKMRPALVRGGTPWISALQAETLISALIAAGIIDPADETQPKSAALPF